VELHQVLKLSLLLKLVKMLDFRFAEFGELFIELRHYLRSFLNKVIVPARL
jgi:hypothetical protein